MTIDQPRLFLFFEETTDRKPSITGIYVQQDQIQAHQQPTLSSPPGRS
jgi:hypothetical protein